MSKKEIDRAAAKGRSSKMVYCDGAKPEALPLNSADHKDVHYMVVDGDEDTPKGFRESLAKPKKAAKAEK